MLKYLMLFLSMIVIGPIFSQDIDSKINAELCDCAGKNYNETLNSFEKESLIEDCLTDIIKANKGVIQLHYGMDANDRDIFTFLQTKYTFGASNDCEIVRKIVSEQFEKMVNEEFSGVEGFQQYLAHYKSKSCDLFNEKVNVGFQSKMMELVTLIDNEENAKIKSIKDKNKISTELFIGSLMLSLALECPSFNSTFLKMMNKDYSAKVFLRNEKGQSLLLGFSDKMCPCFENYTSDKVDKCFTDYLDNNAEKFTDYFEQFSDDPKIKQTLYEEVSYLLLERCDQAFEATFGDEFKTTTAKWSAKDEQKAIDDANLICDCINSEEGDLGNSIDRCFLLAPVLSKIMDSDKTSTSVNDKEYANFIINHLRKNCSGFLRLLLLSK